LENDNLIYYVEMAPTHSETYCPTPSILRLSQSPQSLRIMIHVSSFGTPLIRVRNPHHHRNDDEGYYYGG
jgi:hypothetical protein